MITLTLGKANLTKALIFAGSIADKRLILSIRAFLASISIMSSDLTGCVLSNS